MHCSKMSNSVYTLAIIQKPKIYSSVSVIDAVLHVFISYNDVWLCPLGGDEKHLNSFGTSYDLSFR